MKGNSCIVENRKWFRYIKVRLLLVVSIIFCLSANSYAATNQLIFNIQSQEIGSALDAFVEKTQISLIYDLKDLGDVKSKKVIGKFAPDKALTIMLEGTGLLFMKSTENAISISKDNHLEQVAPSIKADASKAPDEKAERISDDSQANNFQQVAQSDKMAESGDEKPEGEFSDDYILEDTVVTATKTGETRLQETPIAISAFSSEALQSSGILRLDDLGQIVPNTEFASEGGYTRGYIRGVGNVAMGPTEGDSNIAYYMDGVYIERGEGLNSGFFDIERVEVLRGPQGTLYGRNANGGAINFITKAPTDEFEVAAAIEYGSFNKLKTSISVSGPIAGDNIKARLSAYDLDQNGLLKNIDEGNDALAQDATGIRGSVDITPADIVDIRLAIDYLDTETSGGGYKLLSANDPVLGLFGPELVDDFWKINTNDQSKDDWQIFGVSGKIRVELADGFHISSLTAYREVIQDLSLDLDGFQETFLQLDVDITNRYFMQEFQLQAVWGRFNTVAGLSYYQQENDFYNETYAVGLVGPFLFITSDMEIETKSQAAFANVRYALTDRVSLEAGIRYTVDEKKVPIYDASVLLVAAPEFGDVFGLAPDSAEDDWDALTPKFVLDYRITDDMLVYASIARGYRPGGFDQNALSKTLQEAKYDPEFLWNYELGIKSDWLGNRFRANATFFYSDYTDMQVTKLTGGFQERTNAGEAKLQGVELELLARPVNRLTLNAGISYLDATFDEYTAPDPNDPTNIIGIDLSGNKIPYVPDWKLTFGAQYILPIGELGFLTLRGDIAWRDDIYCDQYERTETLREEYTIVNGLVRFERADGLWGIELYGKNLFEEEYYVFKAMSPGSTIDTLGYVGEPRTLGARLTFNF